MRRVRVLHIITKLELGGAQKIAMYTISHLNPERFERFFFSNPGGILNPEAGELENVDFRVVENMVRRISPAHDLKAYGELKKMIREIEPDIVHTHSSKAGILGRLAAHACKVPVVIHTIHGFGIDAVKIPLMRMVLLKTERFCSKRTTHFVAVSQQNIDLGRKLKIIRGDNVSRIYAGVDLKTFREARPDPALLAELGIRPGAPLVGIVSCFKPQKNPLRFIETAAAVHREVPDAQFLMIGDGELREAIEKRISELHLENVVVLAGWRRDVPQLVKMMNVSVLTSLWEGLPMVIPESLSAGVPVVVTRSGGSAEAVIEGITGFVCDQDDQAKLENNIIFLLKNPEIAKRMGQAGPNSVSAWDIDEMVRLQESLYEKLLSDAGLAI